MRYFLPILMILLSSSVRGQDRIALETQAYPAGLIPGLRFDLHLSNQSYLSTRVAYNLTDRRDWGKNDNEEGGGPGFSFGYVREAFLTDRLNLHIRSDLWFLNIDWLNTTVVCPFAGPCFDLETTGKTKVTVLQPTAGLSFDLLRLEQVILQPSLMFGYEINIQTRGEEVGQGAILLGGLILGYQF